MLRRPSISLAVLLAALALPAAAGARVPHGFVGMVLSDPLFPASSQGPAVDLSRQFDGMVGAGVENLRVVFNWSSAQPYANAAQVPVGQASQFSDVGGVPTSFAETDQIVALAAEHRITLLPVVLYAPAWDTAPHPAGTYGIPADDAPYAAYLTALIARYGPRGSFWSTHSPKVPIRAWQVWNEPNIRVFWPAVPFQRSYTKLLRAAHDAIKRADRGARVILAGMPNFSWTDLRSLYRVPGARRLFDVVAVHPYTREPDGVIAILTRVRRVMDRSGDARKPMIADEISWPSSQGKTSHTEGFDFGTTERGQARNLGRMLPMLAARRRQLGLTGFDYYTWAGTEDRGGISFEFSGLLRLAGGRLLAKPALSSFRHAALALEGCRRKGAVATACRERSHERGH